MTNVEDYWHTSTPKKPNEGEGLRSVSAALDVLECFATDRELGVSDVARRMGLAKSTTHRLLTTLRSRGFIEQNPENGRYRLGLHLLELGHLAQVRNPLRQVALPVTLDLVRRTGLTVNVSVPDGADIVFIERTETSAHGRTLSQSGRRLPAHVSSAGKAVAAFLPEFAKARAEAGFPPRARQTIRTPAEWEAALREVRQRGFAMSRDESFDGITTVAVPIMFTRQAAQAALSFFGGTHDVESRYPLLVQYLQRAAGRIQHDVARLRREQSA